MNSRFLMMLILACCGLTAAAANTDQQKAEEAERRLANYNRSSVSPEDKVKLKQAIDYLRNYYVAQKDEKKLLKLNQRIEEVTQVKERNKELLACLMELENIACRLGLSKPDDKTAKRIRSIIATLQEFRWGERDLARALSYVAIGRAYYLLGDYSQALRSSMVDPELFAALDKKYKEQNNGEASPLAALLFLAGNCCQALAGQTADRQDKIKFLGMALVHYYRFAMDYRSSQLVNDAVTRYENCRSQLEKLSGSSLASLEELKNIIPGNDRLPNSITMLVQTGNYSQAGDMLEKEVKTRSNHSSYPVYALCLAECYAHENRGNECTALLQTVIEKYNTNPDVPSGILRCGGILREHKSDIEALALFQIVIDKFPDSQSYSVAALSIAEYRLKKLREMYSQDKQEAPDFKVCAADVVKLFNQAEAGFKNPKQQFYIFLGRAEANFMAGDYNTATDDYRKALQLPELNKSETASTASNLARSMYYSAISKKPEDKDLLNRADKVIADYQLLAGNANEAIAGMNADSYRLAALIKDKSGQKKEAADLLLKMINSYPYTDFRQKVKDMITATAIFYELNDITQASKLLQDMSAVQSGDINDIRFRIGKDLFERGRNKEAFKIFDALLKGEKNLSPDKLLWLLEKLSDATGEDSAHGWYIAFKAGRLADGMDIVRNGKNLNLVRLKTASAAMRLGNFPTALAIINMVLEDKNSSLVMSAKFIKAEVLAAMGNYLRSNDELSEIALTATRMEQYGLFLRAKYNICKNMISAGDKKGAIMIVDNLLLPLKKDENINKADLPEIYQDILFTAASVSDPSRRTQYAVLYRRLFPAGKFQNKAILNIE